MDGFVANNYSHGACENLKSLASSGLRAGVGLSVSKLQGDEWVDTPRISGPALLKGTLRGSAALQSERRNGHGLTQQLTNTQ